MQELPIIVTVSDAKDPGLLVRLLRTFADKISQLGTRIDKLSKSIKIPSFSDIRASLQASGSTPINVTGLSGTLSDPQPAAALRYATVPTGLSLQGLKDAQFILVTNGAGYDLYTVKGGNPSTLFKLIAGASGGNLMTTDTVQTVTASKTFSALQTMTAGLLMGDGTGAPFIRIDGAAANARDVRFQTGTVNNNRWFLRANATAEGGSDAGSDFEILAFNDSGALTFTPVSIKRSTGKITLSKTIESYNGTTTAGTGVPYIVGTASGTLQTASTGTLTVHTTPVSTGAGLYRTNFYVRVSVAGTGGTLAVDQSWDDGIVSTSTTVYSGISLTTTSSFANSPGAQTAPASSVPFVFFSAANKAITFAVTLTGATGTPKFDYYVAVERLI